MKIAVLGAAGRMGRTIAALAAADPEFEICALCERPDFPDMGREAVPGGPVYTADWPDCADCAIDFTFHAAVPAQIARAAERGTSYVLGTTGLSPEERAAVEEAARRIPVVASANMSPGVNLMLAMVEKAAAALGDAYDAEIVEMHHRMKKDAPSGTAAMLLEAVARGRGVDLRAAAVYGRRGIVGERPRGEIGVHALRGGSVVGDHSVIFAGDVERIEFVHRAQSRDAFAAGALRAALWTRRREPGLYSMRDVLGLA